MKKIKLMPDYHCFPLWRIDDDICCNIDPYSLPVSNMLAEELINWANEYDKTLNMNDPVNSGFENTEKEQAFIDKVNNLFNLNIAQESIHSGFKNYCMKYTVIKLKTRLLSLGE